MSRRSSTAFLAFATVWLAGIPLVLLAHQRDGALWRAAAIDRVTRVGAHLEHTVGHLTSLLEGSFPIASTSDQLAAGRLPRFVRAVQLVVGDAVVLETKREESVPELLTCDEHTGEGRDRRLVPYQTLPRLEIAACLAPHEALPRGWLVAWLDTEGILRDAGLFALAERGFDYRLLDGSGGTELSLAASRSRTWPQPVRYEMSLPGGEWVLELAPQEPLDLAASLTSGSAIVFALASLLAGFVYRAMGESHRLDRETARLHDEASNLQSRLTQEFERRRGLEIQLKRGLGRDGLTELPNRATFNARLGDALDAIRRRAASADVLLFDTAQLRKVNDTMGRHVGDQILKGIARRIEGHLSPEHVLARIGGDQFGVLRFKRGEIEDTVRLVEDILDDIERPFSLAGTDIFVSCHVGVVVPDTSYRRAEDILRDATLALNKARTADGARLQVFGQEMHARALKLLEIETDLRRAVERGEMVAYYQPILSLDSGRIIGFETLVRWLHPERGIVSPADFIPLAEQTGLIIQIDRWNLAAAARQLAEWQERYPRDVPLKMSANLAANELSRPDIVDFVASVLEETQLDPRTLAIEVTESGVMKSPETAEVILKGLKALGVHLHLDDFGTGYSSLAYLHRFSFDLLKIDRAFVGRMTSDGKSYELVKTVMALARALEMGVVAEGIETREQLAKLRALGCEMAQGFLFSRPIPADEIGPLLDEEPVW